MSPVVRFAVKVHYREDHQLVTAFIVIVNDPKRKSTDKAPADAFFNEGPHIRMRGGSLYRRIHFGRELIPKRCFSLLVVIDCESKLLSSLWMERVSHHGNRFQISSKTSSPDIGFTVPDQTSFKRRLATSAHFLSISASGGFKLLSTESATRARSSTGSDSISRNKSSVFMKSSPRKLISSVQIYCFMGFAPARPSICRTFDMSGS